MEVYSDVAVVVAVQLQIQTAVIAEVIDTFIHPPFNLNKEKSRKNMGVERIVTEEDDVRISWLFWEKKMETSFQRAKKEQT